MANECFRTVPVFTVFEGVPVIGVAVTTGDTVRVAYNGHIRGARLGERDPAALATSLLDQLLAELAADEGWNVSLH